MSEAGAALAKNARGHAEGFGAGLVEAAGGAEAGFVDGVGDAPGGCGAARGWGGVGGAQCVLETGDALGLGELTGADAKDPAESTQEGETADAGGPGQVGEARAFGGMLGEVLSGGSDGGGLGVGARGDEVRLAALAGAKASLLGCGCGGEEGDVLPRGAAAGAAGAAINAG